MKPQIMSWEQALKYIYNSDTLLVDLRDKEEYARGHITGAWNIPYDHLEEHLGEMGSYGRVIFYCARGNHSLAAARMIARQGRIGCSVAGGYEARMRKRH